MKKFFKREHHFTISELSYLTKLLLILHISSIISIILPILPMYFTKNTINFILGRIFAGKGIVFN